MIKHIKESIEDQLVNFFMSTIGSKVIYTVTIGPQIWSMYKGLTNALKNNQMISFEESEINYTIPYHSEDKFSTLIWYKGTPIYIWNTISKKRIQNPDMSVMHMSTFATKLDKRNLKRFIKECKMRHEVESIREAEYTYNICKREYSRNLKSEISKSFDDLILPKETLNTIINALDNFVAKRDWYTEHKIPYHFGVLLYSQAGTGKTSIAQAISRYLNASMYIISGDDVYSLPYMLETLIPHSPGTIKQSYQTIIVEDIDCGFKENKETSANKKSDDDNNRESGMASLLNSLDGFQAPTDTVYIFTTNHIEELDPALIRPGRIDLKIHVPCVCKETLGIFIERFYGIKDYNLDDVNIPDGITIPDLHVKVMEGLGVEELIKYIIERSE